jgi:hypothetical protein
VTQVPGTEVPGTPAYDSYLAGKLEDVALDEIETARALRAIDGLPTPA